MADRNEQEHSRRVVVPGVLASKDIKVEIPHPDNCFVVRNEEDTASLAIGGSLGVFSSEELARAHIEKMGLSGAVIEPYQWDELVEKFGEGFADCLVDYRGEEDFYSAAPLRKGV